MNEISRRAVFMAGGGSAASVAAGVALARARWVTGPAGPTRGRGNRTTFGSVALLGSSRLVLAAAGASQHGDQQGHETARPHGHDVSGAPVASAVHGAWTDAVVVDVQVHNGMPTPMELSPGQFRVRVDGGSTTVSLYSADRDAAPVEPGSTTSFQISYLVPPPDRVLSLEFADTGAAIPVRLGRLGRTVNTGELS